MKVALAALRELSTALTAYCPVVVVGTEIRAVNLPSASVVTVPGTVAMAVPAQVTVTVEPEAKLVPLTVVAAKPLEGFSVMAAAAAGPVRAVRFRLVTPPAVHAAV